MSFGLTKENEYILLPESEDTLKTLHQRTKESLDHWYSSMTVQEAMDLLQNRDNQSLARKLRVVEAISLGAKSDEDCLAMLKHRDLEIRSKVLLLSLFVFESFISSS